MYDYLIIVNIIKKGYNKCGFESWINEIRN